MAALQKIERLGRNGASKKAAIYGRISIKETTRGQGSLDAQQALARRFIDDWKTTQGWDVIGERSYLDRGRSGTNTARPELTRLMDDVRDGKINLVVMSKLDRLTRSADELATLRDFFTQHDVEVVSVAVGISE